MRCSTGACRLELLRCPRELAPVGAILIARSHNPSIAHTLEAWSRQVDPLSIKGVDFETVDLVVLDSAPLDIKGRVALTGELLFEIDPAERVEWEAVTRKIHADEQPRVERAWQIFRESSGHRVGRS